MSPEYNKDSIETLEKLVNEISNTFDQIQPQYSTNPIESFNHSRATIASKNIAFRITWRIRAYISIIMWNVRYPMSRIYGAFGLYLPDDVIRYQKKKYDQKTRTREIMSQDSNKKLRALKRKIRRSKYKLNPSDKMIHQYADEDQSDDIRKK